MVVVRVTAAADAIGVVIFVVGDFFNVEGGRCAVDQCVRHDDGWGGA